MIVFALHQCDTTNIGDRSCCPLDYFSFFSENIGAAIRRDVRKFDQNPADVDAIILGGGALGGVAQNIAKAYPNSIKIAWGIGATSPVQAPVSSELHYQNSEAFDLYGCRDYGASDIFVPCVSCMSPLFDQSFEIAHKTVVFGHSSKCPLDIQAESLGIPYADNETCKSMHQAMEFLGSGEHVITSSYHGAYWATLLGRKVSMIPFGSKFYSLKHRPEIVSDVACALDGGISQPDALQECRSTTIEFSKKVFALLKRHKHARTHTKQHEHLAKATFFEGVKCFQQGNLGEAISHFKVAAEYDPTNKVVLYNLALTLANIGNLTEAKKHAKELLSLDANDKVTLELLSKINQALRNQKLDS